MAAAAAAAADGPLCPLLPPGTPDRRLVLLPTEPEDAAAAAPLRQVRLLLRLLKRPGNTQQGNLYLYKIESLDLETRDLGNGKSHQDMLYTGRFCMMCRLSETHS